jgi:choline dehydrogenase-like flavoprotein
VAKGARVYSDCLVERVITKDDRAVGVRGRVLNGPNGKPRGKLTVRARRVVLACSAMYTPVLLERSGVGRRSGQVGRNLTLHPSFRIMARFDERVEGWNGALQSAFSSHYEPEGIQLNSVFVPGGILAAAQPGIGPDHVKRAKQLPHLAIFGINLHDEGGGVVHRWMGREPIVTYRMS